MNTLDALASVCAANDLPYAAEWLPQLQKLAALLAAGQARVNLVGDPSEAGLLAHVRETLTVAAGTLDVLGKAPQSAVDVGAGAGLEALTLAIVWPQARIVAIEPRKLRAAFIAETAAALGLRNVTVIAKSLHSADAGRFQLASARAVWPFPEWPERARPNLAPAGVVAVHAFGPATTLSERLIAPSWTICSARDVPGEKPYAVAMVQLS